MEEPFSPSREDVSHVRALLADHKLPNELILMVLDLARYWVEQEMSREALVILVDSDTDNLQFPATVPYMAMDILDTEEEPSSGSGSQEIKIKEIEFLLVSHGEESLFRQKLNQGWANGSTMGSFETCSWYKVSIARKSSSCPPEAFFSRQIEDVYHDGDSNGPLSMLPFGAKLVPRPHRNMEEQRRYCHERMTVAHDRSDGVKHGTSANMEEGKYAWWLQGNEVGRWMSMFEGEFVRRYTVVWTGANDSRWVGNGGSGRGEGFVDTLRNGDWIVVWARVL
ncbi:hypothetical protein ACEQ8H_000371 [Pleosporales sp. CAS-2024a]